MFARNHAAEYSAIVLILSRVDTANTKASDENGGEDDSVGAVLWERRKSRCLELTRDTGHYPGRPLFYPEGGGPLSSANLETANLRGRLDRRDRLN